jgi:tetratricopeptide (TPR) repeat protein
MFSPRFRASWLCLALLLVAGGQVAGAQPSRLGKVDFPATGSREALAHFERGVGALHSFWFEEALEAFRAATAADPGFLMGYWGEAMAHNHPLWAEQDTEAARKVLAKIGDTSRVTPRERAYMAAVRVLYGEGDKLARDRAYAAAMERVYREYPDDLEAAIFYSLALLGTVRPGDKGYRAQAAAGAIALDVFAKNPNHPGAAHFIIHAFDDPEHAILALPAARRYAQIAPEAHHARHMPSHIFIQLGMWPEAAASNESSWEASVNWVNRKKLPGALRDFHSLHWLLYVYLQQGRWRKAEEILALRQKTLTESGDVAGASRTGRNDRYYADMAAEWVVETEQWDKAGQLFAAMAGAPSGAGEGAGHVHGPAPASSGSTPTRARVLGAYVCGMAAAQRNAADADKEASALQQMSQQLADAGIPYAARVVEVLALQVTALARAREGNYAKAVEAMERATRLEEEMSPPSGPPDLIKPAHELFGEILLAAGRAKNAGEQFARSLERQPNRARSLLGSARAAARSGDAVAAAAAYAKLLEVWRQADAQLAELREARDFVEKNRALATRASSGF